MKNKKLSIHYVGNDKWNQQIKNLIGKVDFISVITDSNSKVIQEICKKNNINLIIEENVNFIFDYLKNTKPDFMIVFGCHYLIKKSILDLFPVLGSHPTKLPERRGRAPIPHTILDELDTSAVTLFLMNEGADSGPIIYQKEFSISTEDTSLILLDKMNECFIELVNKIVEKWPNIPMMKQDENKATYKNKRTSRHSKIHLGMSAKDIEKHVRALSPPYFPPAYILNEKNEKIEILNVRIGERCVTCNDFSYSHYLNTLKLALHLGFKITNFRDYTPSEKLIILRHDVEFNPDKALALAKLEHEEKVNSTYFFRMHCNEYNLLSFRCLDTIKEISDMGHEIGIHSEYHLMNSVFRNNFDYLKFSKETLEKILNVEIISFSLHGDKKTRIETVYQKQSIFKNDASDPKFTKDVKYLSDSNGRWREGCFCENLKHFDKLHILIHPYLWYEKSYYTK